AGLAILKGLNANAAGKTMALLRITEQQARGGDIKGALKTLGLFAKPSFSRVCALAEIATARVRAGDKEAATKVLQEMENEAAALDHASEETKLYVQGAIAEAQAASGRTREAINTAAQAEGVTRDWMLQRVVTGLLARGASKEAQAVTDTISDPLMQA